MKYIITEDQSDRIKSYVIEYLDKNLTPFKGWDPTKEYKERLKHNDGELFLKLNVIRDFGSFEENNHMWYSTCDNPDVSFYDMECPLIALPKGHLSALEGYFGNMWKPIFIEWFQNNTGLKLKNVRYHS